MKLSSPIPPKKVRIEIIPLIDIMFFLLACFMLVSLSMTQMRGMKVSLPSAATATPENKSDFHAITIDAIGNLYLEKEALAADVLIERVKQLAKDNPEARFYIRADENATHGEVVRLLDRIKKSGIQKVAFEIKAQSIPSPVMEPAPAAIEPTPITPRSPNP
jgi:biopolymer transport protein ExbD